MRPFSLYEDVLNNLFSLRIYLPTKSGFYSAAFLAWCITVYSKTSFNTYLSFKSYLFIPARPKNSSQSGGALSISN